MRLYALFAILLSLPALAQSQVYVKISAGTGFVVNRDGDVVTNAHVLKDCQSVSIRMNNREVPATVLATDTAQDLAVLRLSEPFRGAVAPMRWNIRDLSVGDNVIVMGYPGDSGIRGQSRYRKTAVKALRGPSGEEKWIQLASVAEQGNSGGPVLDTTGNVIAVISGVAMTYKIDKNGTRAPEYVGKSDVAITLAALQDFLHANQIGFFESASGVVAYSDAVIQEYAGTFILPVHCIQGTR